MLVRGCVGGHDLWLSPYNIGCDVFRDVMYSGCDIFRGVMIRGVMYSRV